MPGTLEHLPSTTIEGHRPTGKGTDDHPMRIMTRRAAGLVGPAWDDQARLEVATYFDAMAAEWHTRTSPERDAVVVDALDRGVGDERGRADVCVEVGSGIGAYTPELARRWRRVVAVEVALEMHLRAPADAGHRVLADGTSLPLRDGEASAVALINCFLFPQEVDRVLAPDGILVWVNSSGTQTPIYLTAEEVLEALPGTWHGVAAEAGIARWSVYRRA